jgi:hypothetical protein
VIEISDLITYKKHEEEAQPHRTEKTEPETDKWV